MSISLHNPCPDETIWRLFLPDESPLQYLTYGLMTYLITNKVKKIRKDNRNKRRIYLIHKINNHNLNKLYRTIYIEAEKLKTFRTSDWYKRGTKKLDRVRFFKSNNIPLIYLEDALKIQNKGVVKFKVGDLIKTDHSFPSYGIVEETKNNIVYYKLVDYKYIGVKKYEPIWHVYDEGVLSHFKQEISAWRCTKLGEETDKIRIDRYKYYYEINRRICYWENNEVLRVEIAPKDWLNLSINVFAGEVPKYLWMYNQIEIDTWKIIKNQISENPPLQ